MSDCRYGVSPVNYPDPDPDHNADNIFLSFGINELMPVCFRTCGRGTDCFDWNNECLVLTKA